MPNYQENNNNTSVVAHQPREEEKGFVGDLIHGPKQAYGFGNAYDNITQNISGVASIAIPAAGVSHFYGKKKEKAALATFGLERVKQGLILKDSNKFAEAVATLAKKDPNLMAALARLHVVDQAVKTGPLNNARA